MYFCCPKCLSPLVEGNNSARCEKGHSFDKSREGYYNLLLTGKGGTHGDNKEMIEARREFLGLGYYEPLANEVAAVAAGCLKGGGMILDAGCGEGYYSEKVSLFCKEAVGEGKIRVIGFDISKDAVKRASKRQGIDSLCVASSYKIPLGSDSVDMVVNVFSPMAIEETKRVLKKRGKLILAIPGEDHLFGLKSAIYDTPYKNKPEGEKLEGFEFIGKRELRYNVKLKSAEEVRSLFMMTPYAYRTGAEGRERVLGLRELETEVHFLLLLYEKR